MTFRNADGSIACICHAHLPACNCLLDSPPLVPFHPSPDQSRFLHLHAHHLVDRWRWLMQGSLLRAWAGRTTATLSRAEVDALVDAGLLFKGAGAADVHLTDLGRDVAGRKEVRL